MQFEHHTHLNFIKYVCQFKNCNRSYSDKKTLNKHKIRCKHFEEAMLESKISEKSTVHVEEIENDFIDEIKIKSEIRIQKSSFEMTNISNNEIESENNTVFDRQTLNLQKMNFVY